MKIRLSCIPLLLAFATTAWCDNPKDELKGVKREIRAKRQLISKTLKVETAVSTELQEIDRNLVQKVTDLGRLGRELAGVESGIEHTTGEIARVTDEARRKKLEIVRRLTSLYKAGELGALRMFFSAESFPQMAENIRYMRSILENDKKIFAEYNDKIEQLHRLKIDLERDAAKKEQIKQGIAQKKREIEQEKSKKAA